MTTYTRRITNGVQFEYYEVAADSFPELIEAEANVVDHIYGAAPAAGAADVVQDQAVQTLQNGGVVNPNPGRRGPVQEQQQPQQGWQSSVPEEPPAQEYCQHGPKKWVPPGFSQTKQKSYAGFFACPAPRGQQCR